MTARPRRAVALLAAALAAAAAPQARLEPAAVATPADLYGPLFRAVQEERVFPDGKTFVDAVPSRPPAEIMADYARTRPKGVEAPPPESEAGNGPGVA